LLRLEEDSEVKYLVAVIFCTCVFAHSQTQNFSCPRRTEDMLNYFVMAYPDRVDRNMGPGNANPIYSSITPDYGNNLYAANGYFIWTKSLSGYPWDIKTFDSNFIYDRATELGWRDPTSFNDSTRISPCRNDVCGWISLGRHSKFQRRIRSINRIRDACPISPGRLVT